MLQRIFSLDSTARLVAFLAALCAFAWGDVHYGAVSGDVAKSLYLERKSSETGIHPRHNEKPPDITTLMQNEPNPASRYTVICFYLAEPGQVCLQLYSLSGRLIGYFIDGYQLSGWYSVGFYTGFLAKGEYVYRLSTPIATSTRKMLVAR
jgi:hypothetical protein